MKLYLSSYKIPNIEALAGLFETDLSEVKTALVPNAGDYYAERAKNFKINANITVFNSIGLKNIEVVDLQDYRDENSLKKKLQEFNLILVTGGNTFCLREEMRKSGFENIISDLLQSGIVYAGESAGALVIGNSLKGIEFADNPEFAEEAIWEGLNILPNYILPHVGSEFFGEAIEKAKELHNSDSDIIELTDQQALVVNGSSKLILEGTDNADL